MNIQNDIDRNDNFLQTDNVDHENNIEVVMNNEFRTTETMNNQLAETTNNLRRSQKMRKATWKVKNNQEKGLQSYGIYKDYVLQDEMTNPMAFLAKTDEEKCIFIKQYNRRML